MIGPGIFPILGAAVASWVFGALWYGLLGARWMAALGKSKAELTGPSGRPSPVPFVLSFVAEILMAAVLGALLVRVGAITAATGAVGGLIAWIGFVATTLAVNHAYSRQTLALTAIDGGHWLGVMLLQGAVLGALA